MSEVLAAVASAAPLVAGWSLHGLRLRRRIDAARRDPLTGLPGRDAFGSSARRDLRAGGGVVVLVDLDGFKAVNDAHGHAAGDAVLTEAADRLQSWAGLLGGCAGRLGGDEFAATALIMDPARVPFELHGLDDSLCAPVRFREVELPVRASIGAFVTTGLPVPDLGGALRRADEAMYAAKRAGGGWRIADGPIPEMTTTNGRRTGRPGTTVRAGVSR
ncbi:GGDEF domain-containing protein [Streptomyces albireticuli]|uniref:GGDEF domain-containing protein n=1 Tax=Streptomyces albireticuli TaxID=1940 RepID=A0A2A2D7N6_9ACTN|nr:GGDEF domain-containing protein [Streptomyces albireticuli]MCD9144364.1 GGDEF domain-containing protein [Streptomyces albireticuli]MCD9161993.1 GGDEF domain-containing protein [Streptomyces albireticuli]MCD9194001.1 GGDEF domain-containing protein [Streptomyces albireticuli]PAU47511.1 GGDEF domain-containing protein [Streptomyces albireticuli]